jgi:arylsulfatase A-like enzyme
MDRLASQIDLLPTVLSLIGVSGLHPAPGIDLTRPDLAQLPERTIMQYGDTQAYRENDQIVILRKGDAAKVYNYRDGTFSQAPQDAKIIRKAQALAAWPVRAYRERQYRLPADNKTLNSAAASH